MFECLSVHVLRCLSVHVLRCSRSHEHLNTSTLQHISTIPFGVSIFALIPVDSPFLIWRFKSQFSVRKENESGWGWVKWSSINWHFASSETEGWMESPQSSRKGVVSISGVGSGKLICHCSKLPLVVLRLPFMAFAKWGFISFSRFKSDSKSSVEIAHRVNLGVLIKSMPIHLGGAICDSGSTAKISK